MRLAKGSMDKMRDATDGLETTQQKRLFFVISEFSKDDALTCDYTQEDLQETVTQFAENAHRQHHRLINVGTLGDDVKLVMGVLTPLLVDPDAKTLDHFFAQVRTQLQVDETQIAADQETIIRRRRMLKSLMKDTTITVGTPAQELRPILGKLANGPSSTRNGDISFFVLEKVKFDGGSIKKHHHGEAPKDAFRRGALVDELTRILALAPENGGPTYPKAAAIVVNTIRNAPFITTDLLVKTFNDAYRGAGDMTGTNDRSIILDAFNRHVKIAAPAVTRAANGHASHSSNALNQILSRAISEALSRPYYHGVSGRVKEALRLVTGSALTIDFDSATRKDIERLVRTTSKKMRNLPDEDLRQAIEITWDALSDIKVSPSATLSGARNSGAGQPTKPGARW